MQVYTLPLRNDFPSYKFKIELSGLIYLLSFRYNTRMQRWILDILDTSGNYIVNGLPILLGVALNDRFVMDGIPSGALICLDDTDKDTQPERNSFGSDHTLLYVDPNV